MKAIGYRTPGPITDEASLVDIELSDPVPTGRDILVQVRAVSVNPVDFKVRGSSAPEGDAWKVLGWDASGVVVATGPETTLFKAGDKVFYAGSIRNYGPSPRSMARSAIGCASGRASSENWRRMRSSLGSM